MNCEHRCHSLTDGQRVYFHFETDLCVGRAETSEGRIGWPRRSERGRGRLRLSQCLIMRPHASLAFVSQRASLCGVCPKAEHA